MFNWSKPKKTSKKVNKNENSFDKILHIVKNDNKKIDQNIPAILVENYNKKFKKFVAIKNANLSVNNGSIHGFIGPNGSGKTTVIKALIGAYIPTSGKLLINGKKAGSKKANELIGYIPERASFPKHLNSVQYLKTMGEYSGLSAKESKTRAIAILKILNLFDHAKRKPTSFSSGMQKKILLAQALLIDPKILILDEPAANLDPTARKELFDQLITLRNQGRTIFISSHILSELERIVDEVTFIYYGEVIYSGNVEELNYKNNSNNSIFIKSKNNKKLLKLLQDNNYECIDETKVEIEVLNIKNSGIEKLFKFLAKQKIEIINFRANDLQSIYNKLLEQSENNKNKNLKNKE